MKAQVKKASFIYYSIPMKNLGSSESKSGAMDAIVSRKRDVDAWSALH